MQKYLNKDNLCALLCLLVVVFTVRSAKAEFPTVFAFPDLSAGTKQEEPPKDTEPPVISARAVVPVMDALEKDGFFIRDSVRQMVTEQAGE